jgi:hypothetical protein
MYLQGPFRHPLYFDILRQCSGYERMTYTNRIEVSCSTCMGDRMVQAFGRNDRTFNQAIHAWTGFHFCTRFTYMYAEWRIGNLKYLQIYGYRLITSQYSIVSFSLIL